MVDSNYNFLQGGGAVSVQSPNSRAVIVSSAFYGNKVMSIEQERAGAGVYIGSGSSLTLFETIFYNNQATNGTFSDMDISSLHTDNESNITFFGCDSKYLTEESTCASVPNDNKRNCSIPSDRGPEYKIVANGSTCKARGCCWYPVRDLNGEIIHESKERNVSWCFHKTNAATCSSDSCGRILREDREKCIVSTNDSYGVECLEKGCCYDPASMNLTCFRRRDPVRTNVSQSNVQILENINRCGLAPRSCPLNGSSSSDIPFPTCFPAAWHRSKTVQHAPAYDGESPSPSSIQPEATPSPKSRSHKDVGNSDKIVVIDPRLSSIEMTRVLNSKKNDAPRRLISVNGDEQLIFRGRNPPSTLRNIEANTDTSPHKLFQNFLNGSKLFILTRPDSEEEQKIELKLAVDNDGHSITAKLPSYQDLCQRSGTEQGEPHVVCSDGFYLTIEISVPMYYGNATTGKRDSLGNHGNQCLLAAQKFVDSNGKTWCRVFCGPGGAGDFSGCPSARGGGALYLLQHSCDEFAMGDACLNEQTAHTCAYQINRPSGERVGKGSKNASMIHECRACVKGAICPGGARIWPQMGYWVSSETDLLPPKECPAPARERCRGWDVEMRATLCGAGYAQLSYLCGQCADGYFHTIDNQTCRSCALAEEEIEESNLTTAFWIFLGSVCGALLLLGTLVTSITYYIGGDLWMGISRGIGFIYYSLCSLQILAQVGQQATGYEHPVVLQIYRWITAVSSVDTEQAIHVECITVGGAFFLDNLLLGSVLFAYAVWIALTYFDVVACCCRCPAERGCSCMIYLRRFTLTGLILLASVTTRMAARSTACVRPSPQSAPVLISRPSIVCYGELHAINGMLGWVTFITYCVGFPVMLTWLALRSKYFDHKIRRNTGSEKLAVAQLSKGESAPAKSVANPMISQRHRGKMDVVFEDSSKGQKIDATFCNGKEIYSVGSKVRTATKDNTFSTSSKANMSSKSNIAAKESTTSVCCCNANLFEMRKRQHISVLKFVRNRRSTYISFKSLIEGDFHLSFLPFCSARLLLLFTLAMTDAYVPRGAGVNAWLRFGLGGAAIIGYPAAIFYFQPLRRTRSWKLPVIFSIFLVTFVALLLHLFAANGNDAGVQVLSSVLIVAISLLIAVVIPTAAVIEIVLGARRDVRCIKLRERIKALSVDLKRKSSSNNGDPNLQNMLLLGLHVDEEDMLKDLIDAIEQQHEEMNETYAMKHMNTTHEELTTAAGSSQTANKSEWQAAWDPNHQAWYYYNAKGESRWTIPEKTDDLKDESFTSVLSRIRSELQNHESGRLHTQKDKVRSQRGDWLEVVDEKTGKTAYVNEKTLEIRENRPPGWVASLANAFNRHS